MLVNLVMKMPQALKKTTVKGGSIARSALSGRVVHVVTKQGVSKANPKSETAVKEASSKRSDALKRLADR
jgi:NADH dehydrogenase FAD-containing subunit